MAASKTTPNRVEGEWHAKWLRSLLESCVLSVLLSGPAYGYEIGTRISSAGFTRPKGGTLYPILVRLEKDGVVISSWMNSESGPSRKYYALTDEGEAYAKTISGDWATFTGQVSQIINI